MSDPASVAAGSLTSSISTGVVRLFAEYLGRGPTKARTFLDSNMVSVVLQDTLTRAEHHLIEVGEAQSVRSTRRLYQDTMREPLVELIESLTGRKVCAFLSDHQPDPDYAVETFILEPLGTGAGEDMPAFEATGAD